VSPEPDAGPRNEPLPKLPEPVTESVVAAVTASVPELLSVSDETTYVPPVSVSLAPELTVTLPYAPAAIVSDAPELSWIEEVPACAGGIVGGAGIAGKVERAP
jgi:hypothetical protein